MRADIQTDRQTNKQTDKLITVLRTPAGINNQKNAFRIVLRGNQQCI